MATEVVAADTFPKLLLQHSSQRGASPAIRKKSRGIWHTTSWFQLANEAATLAAALAARGLKRGGHLAVLGDNCPRLNIAVMAAHWLGAVAVPFSRDAAAGDLIQSMRSLGASGIGHVFAEDQEQVDRLLAILPQCAGLQCIVYDNERGMRHYRQPQLVSYAALLQSARAQASHAEAEQGSGDDAAFVFHGPNGAKTISYATLIGQARASVIADAVSDNDVVVACLSPASAFQILFSYAEPLLVGHCVCFPESSDTLLSDMREMGPNRLLAPLGALKALHQGARERIDDAGAFKRGLYRRHMKANASAIGKLLVQSPMKDVLGVSRLDKAYVIGEPDDKTGTFFAALGIALQALPDAAAATGTGGAATPAAGSGAAPARAFPIGEPILELENISLRFGGVNALTDISFKVREHEVLAIIGPNGAGKSSMLNVINGVYRPQEGAITLRGERVKGMTPTRAAHMGIARTFQNIALFKGMTVLDNIMAGRTLKMHANLVEVALQLPRARREENEHRRAVEEIIEFLEIEHIRKTPVARLPYGLQKRVELGRALAAEPKILLLDEPMAGMNIEEKQDMSRFVLDVNDHYGTTVVLIEHDMGVVMDISDRVVVLDYGKKIGDGTPDEVRANQNVIDAYLGVAH